MTDVVLCWVNRRRGHILSTRSWGRRNQKVSVWLEKGYMNGGEVAIVSWEV